ncbi:hypothetical protein M404DRAFT_996692 [Pisolithus tinctorius Marx 270]|uniref:Uncharacterized protein n=1 Tax=Pisolithus tinctorius Marx 270 TaxID=870435 RepID=A0A0C3JIN8_PISTI|nr:hypothetical protein M404DRAFT_996692 [Pisolithus tinctorius Marx 270]
MAVHEVHQHCSVWFFHKKLTTFGIELAWNQEFGMTKRVCVNGRGEFRVICNAELLQHPCSRKKFTRDGTVVPLLLIHNRKESILRRYALLILLTGVQIEF